MIKKTICIGAALLMFLSASGCNNEKKAENSSLVSSAAENADDVVITNISISGRKLSFPFEYGELGSGYTLKNGCYISENRYTMYDLYKADNYICTIAVDGEESADNEHREVQLIEVKSPENGFVTFSGLGGGASYDEFKAKLGEAVTDSGSYLEYRYNGCLLSLLFDNETQKVKNVMLIKE